MLSVGHQSKYVVQLFRQVHNNCTMRAKQGHECNVGGGAVSFNLHKCLRAPEKKPYVSS